MARIGFWQLLLDDKVSYWEAQRINEAHDAADTALAVASDAATTSAQRIAQLSREVVMLRTALTVLVNTLKDTNVVDDRLLEARMEAAFEEASRPPERASTAAAAAPPRMVVCMRCRRSVPASTTTLTGDGPMCDRCP